MGLMSVRFEWRVRTSLSCSSSERAVMLRTVRWISRASPEMELGVTSDWRVLSGMVGSCSLSQMWLPSQVSATTSEGRRNGSSRSMRVS